MRIYCSSDPKDVAHNIKIGEVSDMIILEIADMKAYECNVKVGDKISFWFWAAMRFGYVHAIKGDIATVKFDKGQFAGWTVMDIEAKQLTKLIP
jgi:hypothetical protein